jgi:putative lumazine-binding protein
MLKYTREGGAKEIPVEQRKIEIDILDVLPETASVKISSVKFTDYVHLIKWNNEWLIINAVWENK